MARIRELESQNAVLRNSLDPLSQSRRKKIFPSNGDSSSKGKIGEPSIEN